MKIKPKINVILPYKYSPDSFRQEALKKVMSCIEEQKETTKVNLIVTEYSEDGIAKFSYPCDSHYVLQSNKPFNKAWIVNYAIKESGVPNFIILDADNIFYYDFFSKIHGFSKQADCFFCANESILEKGRDNPKTRIINFKQKQAMMGCWYCTAEVFWSVGGMNENYFGYGAEDNDIYTRFKYVLKDIPEMPYTLRHCYHHWSTPPVDRLITMTITETFTPIIIKRLKQVVLGQKEQPTLIEIDDLVYQLQTNHPNIWKYLSKTMESECKN